VKQKIYNIYNKIIKMENEFQKMQRLAGVPVTEVKPTKNKKQLDENFVGIGAINNPFPVREKTDYQLAFDHYMGNINEVEGEKELFDSDAIYDTLMNMSHEELIGALLAAGEEEPGLTLEDWLNGYDHSRLNEGDDVPTNPEDYTKQPGYISEEDENPIDAITMDVPLFIRMLEFAREDASTDMDLHDLADKAIAMSTKGEMLSMDNYEDLVGAETSEEN
jgi:hypothetical protein